MTGYRIGSLWPKLAGAARAPDRLGIVAGGTGSCGQSAGRRAWFTSRAAAQASATGPTCPSLSGLLTVRIV